MSRTLGPCPGCCGVGSSYDPGPEVSIICCACLGTGRDNKNMIRKNKYTGKFHVITFRGYTAQIGVINCFDSRIEAENALIQYLLDAEEPS